MTVRPVWRCPKCGLNQFVTVSGKCRRCGFDPPAWVPEPKPEPEPAPVVAPVSLGRRFAQIRVRLGFSQRQLAAKMNVPRTYISKIENEVSSPTITSLEKAAEAMGINPAAFVESDELIAWAYVAHGLDRKGRDGILRWCEERATVCAADSPARAASTP